LRFWLVVLSVSPEPFLPSARACHVSPSRYRS